MQSSVTAAVAYPLPCESSFSGSTGHTKGEWAEVTCCTSAICLGQHISTDVQGAKVESSGRGILFVQPVQSKVPIVALAVPDRISLVLAMLSGPAEAVQQNARSNRSVNRGDVGCEVNGSVGCGGAVC